ncbi:MAG: hypothetical protein IAF08_12650 [Rhizobacter sp.]|nr:hypothetical protein [Chlorobiales bacterium]
MRKQYDDPRFNRPIIKIPRLIFGLVCADIALIFFRPLGMAEPLGLGVHPFLADAIVIAGIGIFIWALKGVYDASPRKPKDEPAAASDEPEQLP